MMLIHLWSASSALSNLKKNNNKYHRAVVMNLVSFKSINQFSVEDLFNDINMILLNEYIHVHI